MIHRMKYPFLSCQCRVNPLLFSKPGHRRLEMNENIKESIFIHTYSRYIEFSDNINDRKVSGKLFL